MLQIDLVLSVEEVLQSVHLRHLFPPVILDPPRSIRINTPNTLLSEWCDRLKIPKFITEFYLQWFVSDPFFMTGEELADAINQPVSSLAYAVQLPCPVYLAQYPAWTAQVVLCSVSIQTVYLIHSVLTVNE